MVKRTHFSVPRGSSATLVMMAVFGAFFIICAGVAGAVLIPTAGFTDPRTGDGELVLMDTTTGKVKDMGKTVPNRDVESFRMGLNNGIATWYSKGEFKAYDINAKSMKDNYSPSYRFDPDTDPMAASGTHMAFYSSWTNTIVVRETAPLDGSAPSDVAEIPGGPTRGNTRLLTNAGDEFYWVSEDTYSTGSTIYKYDTTTDTSSLVLDSNDIITDMDVAEDRVVYEIEDVNSYKSHRRGIETKVMVYETDTGNNYEHCTDCTLPATGGSLVAVRTTNGLMVSDMDTGGDRFIEERNDVLDVETDGKKVAWSWVPPRRSDPITVMDMNTGEKKVHAPDKVIYGFAMDNDQILMLQSKIEIVDTRTGPDPAGIAAIGLAPVFLFLTIVMGGATIYSELSKKWAVQRYNRWLNWYNSGGAYYYQNYYGYYYSPYYQYPSSSYNPYARY